jgi:phosphatidylethanolamine/phosphatidyl-N-methylethanolamine N-methyltransferase
MNKQTSGGMTFYLGWLKNPKRVGAIAPTSTGMARKMASVVRPESDLPVLELGPGTGVITKAILERGVAPEKVVSVEYSQSFLPGLKRQFPGVEFVYGDALNISQIARDLGIERFDSIVSALPLLNFPVDQRTHLVKEMMNLLAPGRPMIQFSYGLSPPVPAQGQAFQVKHLTNALLNLPPARLWLYTSAGSDSGL